MPSLLDGIRVLESTTIITGSLAGCLLGDLGASIVKVEHPNGGDPFRVFRGDDYSPHFRAYNRNKESLALDLRDNQGRDIYLKLVAESDVLIENFRPGVMERLGLGMEVLRETNPRLIACSITGFGEDGPYKARPAAAAVPQGRRGIPR
ncbi:MAG: CoA transferase, partial [Rhodospirillaceae bacterium]|nr:CoA transferase [Rhodospirillaceae bacterium]